MLESADGRECWDQIDEKFWGRQTSRRPNPAAIISW